MYNPVIVLEGHDRNHASERDRQRWMDAYEAIADRIVQPTLRPRQARVRSLLFYGYNSRTPADLKRRSSPLGAAVYSQSYFARDGGLLSYGVEPVDIFRRAASYVDRILRGANPGDLPVQLPTKFEMVVNLKATKAIVAHRQGKRIQAWQGHGDPANAGAVEFKRAGDPNVREFSDAVVLKKFGDVPEDLSAL
jgi:hypothetical protein